MHSNDGCRVETSSFSQDFPRLKTLRFIDVEQWAIVELQSVPQYLALSYVWGDTSKIRESLLVPGALRDLRWLIPRAVRDAIILTRELGMRYVWVDALCLVQDDPDDVERGVEIMDEIYERSWLTIIAASGHNADAGLPGIGENSRYPTVAIPVTDHISVGLYVPLHKFWTAPSISRERGRMHFKLQNPTSVI